MVYGESLALELGVPQLDSFIPLGHAPPGFYMEGSNGDWNPHYPTSSPNGFANSSGNGFASGGLHSEHETHSRKKRTLHQKSQDAVKLGRDVYDVLIAWTPVVYATGLIGVALHGVYEIFSGNLAQGAAELVGSSGLMTQVKRVRKWSESELVDYRKKRKANLLSKAYKIPLVELDEIAKGDEGVFDNLLKESGKFSVTDDGTLCVD